MRRFSGTGSWSRRSPRGGQSGWRRLHEGWGAACSPRWQPAIESTRARRERARLSSLLLCACGRRPCVCEEGRRAVRITCGLTQAFPHPASESLCWRLIFGGKIFVAVQELAVLEESSGTLTTEARYLFLLLGGGRGAIVEQRGFTE